MVRIKNVLTSSPTCTPSLSTSTHDSSSKSNLEFFSRPLVARIKLGDKKTSNSTLEGHKRQRMELEQMSKREQNARDEHQRKKAWLVGRMIESGVQIPVDGAVSDGCELLDVQVHYILLEEQEKIRLWMESGCGGDTVGEQTSVKEDDSLARQRDHILQDYWTQLKSGAQYGDRLMKNETPECTPFDSVETDDIAVKKDKSDLSFSIDALDEPSTEHNLQDFQSKFMSVERADDKKNPCEQQEQEQQGPDAQIKQEASPSLLQQTQIPQWSPPIHYQDSAQPYHQLQSAPEDNQHTAHDHEVENGRKRLMMERQRQERPLFRRAFSDLDSPNFTRPRLNSDRPYFSHDYYRPSPLPQQQTQLWQPYTDIQKANTKYRYSDEDTDMTSPTITSPITLPHHQQQTNPPPRPTIRSQITPTHQIQQPFQPESNPPQFFRSTPYNNQQQNEQQRVQHQFMTEQPQQEQLIQGLPVGLNYPLTQKEKEMILASRRAEQAEQADDVARNTTVLAGKVMGMGAKGPGQVALDEYEWQLNALDVRNQAQDRIGDALDLEAQNDLLWKEERMKQRMDTIDD